MITPSFALTATERVLPRMALDFTTAVLDSRVTFTRSGNTATVTNSSGVIAAINANLPRFDYDPTTLVCKGLLIEESRTNLLLNSLINGTNLSTQVVTTTADAHTLTFYGTGQIVLTGTSSATVVGTGAYPSRKTLTFTPTVGVLNLTVTGTVQYAQLEIGSFATSFIPTDATSKTRNADVATMTGTNFSDWFNQSAGSFTAEINMPQIVQAGRVFAIDAGSIANQIDITTIGGGQVALQSVSGGVYIGNIISSNSISVNANVSVAMAYSTSINEGLSLSANATQTSSLTYSAGIANLRLGRQDNGAFLNGYLRKIYFWPQRLINAELQAFSK